MPHGPEMPRWYATYTRPRHEKCAAKELVRRAIENYLPLYGTDRKWKNGRHFVEMPLFPGYTFVRIALRDRLNVLRVPGILDFVGFGGKPAPLGDDEISHLKRALSKGRSAEPHPYIASGRKVRVTAGPLAGLRGFVVRRKGQTQVAVSLELIQRSVLVEIDSMELEPEI